MEFNIIIKRNLYKKEKQQIYNILDMCDNDFIPPLSSRTSFKDKYFNTSKKETTVYNYYESLINSNAIYAMTYDKFESTIIAFLVLQEENNNSLYISTICVQMDYRNQGICKKLLRETINYAYANKYANLHTRTWSTNIIQKDILENMGFELMNTKTELRDKEVYSLYYSLDL